VFVLSKKKRPMRWQSCNDLVMMKKKWTFVMVHKTSARALHL